MSQYIAFLVVTLSVLSVLAAPQDDSSDANSNSYLESESSINNGNQYQRTQQQSAQNANSQAYRRAMQSQYGDYVPWSYPGYPTPVNGRPAQAPWAGTGTPPVYPLIPLIKEVYDYLPYPQYPPIPRVQPYPTSPLIRSVPRSGASSYGQASSGYNPGGPYATAQTGANAYTQGQPSPILRRGRPIQTLPQPYYAPPAYVAPLPIVPVGPIQSVPVIGPNVQPGSPGKQN
ncbi:annexin A11 [Papilio machaon]|uniref:annexin A11 n=1 Tax=Papilio machaon TaxID=76193 RepID=UPI001E6661C3|nr:annexin A11 [Papilio machaon]